MSAGGLSGRRILVTGAASGIGAATVRRLVSEGAEVLATDVDAEGLSQLGRETGAATALLDVLGPPTMDAIVSTAWDGVVAAAGIGPDAADPARVLAVNLLAPARLLDAVYPQLTDGASVVLLGSQAGSQWGGHLDGFSDDPLSAVFAATVNDEDLDSPKAYALSKRGVVRLAERLSGEWAPRVRVNVVVPGVIDTPMGRRAFQVPVTRRLLERTPAARAGHADEVASVITFLVSPAASYVSGVSVEVDGGLQAAQRQFRARRGVGAP